jgi:hypothetical protein
MFVLALAALVLSAMPAEATTVLQLNLGEMSDRAEKIYRGTVVAITPTTVQAGGGELPAVTYRLRVEESFKGEFTEEKGVAYTDLTLFGDIKAHDVNGMRQFPMIPGQPQLKMGHDYVLLTTPPSAVGLSTTVGLGQGCFEIVPGAKAVEHAVNAYDNQGLGYGIDGPVSYDELAAALRSRVSE